MSTTPASGMERTTTVVIGTGLSGLAVASELSRHGIDSIVVDGLDLVGSAVSTHTLSLQRCDAADLATYQERNEIIRHLRNYAASHGLDVRNTTRAVQLNPVDAAPEGSSTTAAMHRQWAVHTAEGILIADHIVVTRCAQGQLRRIVAELGIAVGQNVVAAMRAIGIYLVGVGELITPTPKELLRQAKAVGQTISAKARPSTLPSPLGMPQLAIG
ncbi:FAD-dependent monooxygenase [Arthrobacter sp. M4]|uniref:FAD-dependent monooxygenase n=1 Tax=Arthrobacter sp. M4 TaxID=218160 RepID=UPI001CDCE42F|nr:FAD-dependent monooxygenase [Arthrobacter sp. M4]MCA4134199.1 NAD(P)-binding protein [Arthrobacter sp. M4]